MDIKNITKPEQNIISITRTGLTVEELPHLIGPTFMEIARYITEQEANILSTPFVSYKNMDETGQIDEGQIKMEVGFPVNKLIPETEQIKSYVLPSYKALTTLYVGTYAGLTTPYLELLAKIKQLDGKFLGCSYEYYLSDEEIDESKQETIIELPYH